MRAFLLLAAMIMAPAGSVIAAETDDTECDVIAVTPRGPDVRPYFLRAPAQAAQKAVARRELTNSGTGRKSAKSPLGFHEEKTSAKDLKPSVQRLTDEDE